MKKINILSFDCADKSLAVCYLTINYDVLNLLLILLKDGELNLLIVKIVNILLENIITIHKIKVYNNVKCKNDDNVKGRTIGLINSLNKVDCFIEKLVPKIGQVDLVLVEYQMPMNVKSRTVMSQIMLWYIKKGIRVEAPGPSLKNKIYFNKDLTYSKFINRYNTRYVANKNHCKYNFLYWLKLNNLEHLINDINKKNIDDVADSFMQIFGWLLNN